MFVDLSRLDGVLSVTGAPLVARDVVQNLLAEIARTRPGTPVTVLRGTADAPPLAVPPSLQQLPQITSQAVAVPAPAQATVRGAAARRPLKGLVMVAGAPGSREASELAALCGPAGAGWTGLAYGEAQDAHWRWYTDGDGRVDIPVLDLKLTVSARARCRPVTGGRRDLPTAGRHHHRQATKAHPSHVAYDVTLSAHGPSPARIPLSAMELGIFTTLANGGRESLASEVGLHPRSSADFLDALVSLDVLTRDEDGTHRNTPAAGLFLDRAKPSYVGGILEMANNFLNGLNASWAERAGASTRTATPTGKADQSSFILLCRESNRPGDSPRWMPDCT
ncbi:methyltransferase dimerization domain-containing protein [Streptomyces sp. NPDC097610]|uniref:methyltransferase family protein n=1 Tax=Streptomyces sp. NPDC097610 TaxID=3157227 RepID=UPI00331C8AAD